MTSDHVTARLLRGAHDVSLLLERGLEQQIVLGADEEGDRAPAQRVRVRVRVRVGEARGATAVG